MSTKTTFKRIALVAVAALGLGVLSVAPSNAATSGLAITVTAGTAGNTAGTVADTTTAALASVSALTTEANDTISVTFIRKSAPSSGSAITAHLGFVDTSTVSTAVGSLVTSVNGMNYATVFDSKTAVSTAQSDGYIISGAAGYKAARFSILLDTATVPAAGDYVFTVVTTTYKDNGAVVATSTTDVTITVAKLASAITTIDPSKSAAYLNSGTTWTSSSDSSVALVSTAASADQAVIYVATKNANGTAQPESITATVTGPGVIGFNGRKWCNNAWYPCRRNSGN
jgi:hypothetical protein